MQRHWKGMEKNRKQWRTIEGQWRTIERRWKQLQTKTIGKSLKKIEYL